MHERPDTLSWRHIEVYYFSDGRDALIVEGLWPVLERLRVSGRIHGGYFSRHWERGPHIRLHFATDAEHGEGVLEEIRGAAEAYLRRNPSQAALEPGRWEEMQEALGEWESRDSAAAPLAADNSVLEGSEDLRDEFVGGPEAAEVARWFYSDTAPLVAEWLDAARDAPQLRRRIAWELMVGFVWTADPTLRSSHLTFRSHAEAILASPAGGEGLRAAFEQRYARQREQLGNALRASIQRLEAGEESSVAGEYLEVLRRTWARAEPALEEGRIRLPDKEEGRQLHRRETGLQVPNWEEQSEFHSLLLGQRWQSFMRNDNGFKTLRFMVNLLYSTLHQLGISPIERYQTCWFIARAAEDSFGFDSLKLARHGADLPEAGLPG